MAAGAYSLTTGYPKRQGDQWLICGTLTADDTERAFAILSTKYVITGGEIVPQEKCQAFRVEFNENASATATNGTIAVQANSGKPDETVECYFTLYAVGG